MDPKQIPVQALSQHSLFPIVLTGNQKHTRKDGFCVSSSSPPVPNLGLSLKDPVSLFTSH